MSDIGDLHGVFATPLRWNAEQGILGRMLYNPDVGGRNFMEIELGSSAAKFAADYATRERGYGKIQVGLNDMRLTPDGAPPPPWPDDSDYKPAVGWWLWNPFFGELRLETNGALLVRAIAGLWDRIRTFKEASNGLQPVIHFTGSRERFVQQVNKTFFEPVIDLAAWIDRERVPAFRMRQITVQPPIALDSQTPFSALPDRSRERLNIPAELLKPTPKGALDHDLDDSLPW